MDLEQGELCKVEKESYLKDIENLNNAIQAKDQQITNLTKIQNNLTEVVEEKESQLQEHEVYEGKLRRQRTWNLYRGWIGGTAVGTVIGILIMI